MEENNENDIMQINEEIKDDEEPKIIKYRGIKAMPFIIGNETFEKIGAMGTSANLLVYMTTVFNMKNVTATNFLNVYNGTSNFATLLGAFVSDTYLGRYNTIGFATVTSFLQMEKKMNTSTIKYSEETEPHDYKGLMAMPYIIGNETFEKIGAIGTLSNLLVYLSTIFNMKSIYAIQLVNIFHGTTNFGTLLGAFICDSFFGRFKTLAFSIIASFMGLLAIALTALVKNLHPPPCEAKATECSTATPWQMTFLLVGFGLMIIGAGGVRPCNLAFGVDQFNPNTESGKKGINSFFNWYVFTFTFAQLISLTLIVYVQSNVSWGIGLSIPAALMLLACGLFFIGTKIYVKVKPQGSPLSDIVRVLVAAVGKRKLDLGNEDTRLFNYISPDSINSRLHRTNQFRFLDKAAIMTSDDEINTEDGSATNPWKLCTIQQVEEVKCVMRVLPIWAAAIIYHVPLDQMRTYTVFQALQSDRQFGHTSFQIPAASYSVFQMLSLTIFIPIYDRILVPVLTKFTRREGGITLLQRMGIGISLSILIMLVSGLVEEKRRNIALTRPTIGFLPRRGEISSMSGFWLVFQLAVAGLSEAFMSVGQMEFYYKQFPENMRSIAGSLFFCGMAMSNYLSSFLVSIVHKATRKGKDWLSEDLNKGRLDLFYYLIAGLGCWNLVYFLVLAKWYKYKGSDDDEEDVKDHAVVVELVQSADQKATA